MISAWLYIIGGVISIWGLALHGTAIGVALSIVGSAVMVASVLNEWVWHVTKIKVMSLFPVDIVITREWWE